MDCKHYGGVIIDPNCLHINRVQEKIPKLTIRIPLHKILTMLTICLSGGLQNLNKASGEFSKTRFTIVNAAIPSIASEGSRGVSPL